MTTFISKETAARLIKDIKYIMQNPLTDQGIYYVHNDTDMLKGYAMIVGPSETPYFGGFYFFEFTFPTDYPHSPPNVKYCTNSNNIRFNPNLYVNGKVCVSLLNTWRGDQWTSCQSISTILLTLCTLLCNNPILNEPGISINHKDVYNYNEIIEFSNINIAICNIVQKNKDVYLPFFDLFYPYVKEMFDKNYEQIVEFVKNKLKINNSEYIKSVDIYGMNVVINYNYILNKLSNIKIS